MICPIQGYSCNFAEVSNDLEDLARFTLPSPPPDLRLLLMIAPGRHRQLLVETDFLEPEKFKENAGILKDEASLKVGKGIIITTDTARSKNYRFGS